MYNTPEHVMQLNLVHIFFQAFILAIFMCHFPVLSTAEVSCLFGCVGRKTYARVSIYDFF